MSTAKNCPRDAQVMAAILKDMGISEYEPRVINLMLEFTYRYVTDVLDDAKIYSSHAGKKEVDSDDIKLAVECKLDHSFTSPPPKHLLVELSKQKNSVPLPTIKPFTGPKLPPDRYCLSATNYKLKSIKKPPAPKPSWPPVVQQSPVRMSVRPSPITTPVTGFRPPSVMTPMGGTRPSPMMTPIGGVRPSPIMTTPVSGVRPSQMTTPGSAVTQHQMYNRLNAMHSLQTAPVFSGVKRKLEDDDYDSVT